MADKLAEIKRHGKHYTPKELADFLAQRVLVQLGDASAIRVLDPACGDGELLFAMHRQTSKEETERQVTLVGYDLDKTAIDVARSRAEMLGINIEWHQGDFLDAGRQLPQESFDAIITNPPYVRTQQLGQQAAQILAAEFGLLGRIDLMHPFVVLMPRLLRASGVLGLLGSNRFLTTRAGANVRKIFQTRLRPVELYDLGDTKLFNAAVLPAIVIALNAMPDQLAHCKFVSAYEASDHEIATEYSTLYEALDAPSDTVIKLDNRNIYVKVGTLIPSDSLLDPWRLSHQAGDDWLRLIEKATWRTFGEVGKIRVGVKTTADAVFISESWSDVGSIPEDELLLPLITHDNVTAWQISNRLNTKILYPYDLNQSKRTIVDMAKYPNAMAYLEANAERLKSRRYVIEGGREWFEIWVPQKPSLWATPKIVFPDISVNARFALDRTGSIVNGDCYWISLLDIGEEDIAYLMLAVANSSLGIKFYDEVCGNKLYSGRRRWMTQYVSRLPLPDPAGAEARELINLTRAALSDGGQPEPEDVALIDRLVEAAFERSMPFQRPRLDPATLF